MIFVKKSSPFRLAIIIISIFLFSLPAALSAAGAVLINEVAWMGTAFNAADEWVELYNSSASAVDLTGWGLYEAGGSTLIITLSGSIAPSGYYLIERTDDTSISDIMADVFGPFAGSGLNNSGEYLALKDASGAVVDSINASAGWPAGDNASKASMERKSDGTWQTNDGITKNGKDAKGGNIIGTPKAQNSGVVSGSSSSSSTSTSTPPATGGVVSTPSVSSGGGGSGISFGTSTPVVSLKAVAGADIIAEVNQTIKFDASKSEGATSYKWYWGDGSVKEGAVIDHSYQFPGTYLVTLEVSNGTEIALDQIKVSIFGGKAVINEIFGGSAPNNPSWIEIFNPTRNTLDIGNWILEINGQNFVWPQFTVMASGGYLVLSQTVSNLSIGLGSVKLKYPNGLTIDEVVLEKVIQGASASRTANGFFWTKELTPGHINIVTSSGGALLENMRAVPNLVASKPETAHAQNYIASFYSQVGPWSPQDQDLAPAGANQTGFWRELAGELVFWIILAVVLGLFVSLFYIKIISRNPTK